VGDGTTRNRRNLNGRGGLDLAANLCDDQEVQVLRRAADGVFKPAQVLRRA
jgi:hypothetical protein